MRYHLDTIPVWDALRLGGTCPLCALRSHTEHTLVDRYLGASVMEPDTRIQVNKKDFAPVTRTCCTRNRTDWAMR